MTIISLFAGAGGMDLGFKKAGFNIIWANEYDKTIWDTYRFNHSNTFLDTRSIRDVPSNEVPSDIIGIIGGPPCQSWSLAGSMRGIEDDRGQLFHEYLRILKDKQPLFFVAENVPGMISKTHLSAFLNIKSLFAECGYNVAHGLLNANDYGVAQERKRVFIVGYRNDLGIVFDFKKLKPHRYKPNLKDAIGDLPEAIPALEKNKTNGELEIANHEYFIGDFSSMYMSRNRRKTWEEASFTIQAGGRHAPIHPASCPMEKLEKDKWKFTGDNYRRLSVRECARIQTFPDSFIFKYKSLADAYKMIGNAVPSKLAENVAIQVREDLVSIHRLQEAAADTIIDSIG